MVLLSAGAAAMIVSGGLVAAGATACAGAIDEGLGIVYGDDHVFSLRAPQGWVLDNSSGVSQGVHAAFYPEGETWKTSPSVAYARARTRTAQVSSAEDQVRETVREFHEAGSPNYKAEKSADIEAEGKKAAVYHFSGDKWGNSEAVAYFVEDKTINFIVFNARDDATFRKYLPAFGELVKSYRYIGDKSETKRDGDPVPESGKSQTGTE